MANVPVDTLTDSDLDGTLRANLEPAQIASWASSEAQRLATFVAKATAASQRLVVVTSGGTSVPLERNPVRFVTNFSTGGRGSKLAEVFLETGGGDFDSQPQPHAVIFLCKRGSLLPFHRVLQTNAQPLGALDDPKVLDARQRHAACHDRLHVVEFDSVIEYLFRLRHTVMAVNNANASSADVPRPLVLLAAAVSDYYIPLELMAQHKMSGAAADGTLSLTFHQVPKALGVLRREWGPNVQVVSFKLETDPTVLEDKALGNLHKFDNDAVVANLLPTYKTKATVFVATATASAGDDGEVRSHSSVALELQGEDLARCDAELERRIVATLLKVLPAS